jgi:hypothetical protein
MQNNLADSIVVVEDFVSKEFQLQLQRYIENAELPLYYNFDTMGSDYVAEYPKENEIEFLQFTHNFVRHNETKSNWWSAFEPICFFFNAKTGAISNQKLSNCKLNLNTKIEKCSADKHFTIHRDMGKPAGITAIYYVNDSDGDTLFFNETGTEVIKRVTPKQGTMVYFNNQIPHAGQPPVINNYRAVLNFNWV